MRHQRWVKLREHTYICARCGCGKVNFQERGGWAQRYILPSGQIQVLRHTPPCEAGPKTREYLDRYAAEIAQAVTPAAEAHA